MFEAVIFDWDGTLADTRQVIVFSFQRTLNEIKIKVTDEYVERRIGIGAAETFREILQAAKTSFKEELIQQLVERKSQLEIEFADQVRLFPGAKDLLEALQNKVKVGLASMNNNSVITQMLKTQKIENCFQAISTAESISHSKPNPEIFLETASKLKTSPEKCVVFEDSIFGVKAAKSAHMGCIAVTTGVYAKRELEVEKPDLIVKTLNDNRILPFILK